MSEKPQKSRVSRRKFLTGSALAAAAISVKLPLAQGKATPPAPAKKFNLSFAPHFGMFRNSAGEDKIDQLKFIADQGFHAFEHNGMKSETVEMQEKIAQTMNQLGLRMGVFVANQINWTEPTLTIGDKAIQDEFVKQIKESVEVAKRVNAKWMTVVPGHLDLKKDIGFQTGNVIEALKRGSEIFEPHGFVMVLEPLNFFNHPGLFLTDVPQGYAICKAVGSPACKILYDIYHQQIQKGNLIPNIDQAWSEIGYFQIGDNPGRKEPTTGEINYKNVFQHIHDKGFDGIYGMEHGNSKPGKEGEEALIQAYRSVDTTI